MSGTPGAAVSLVVALLGGGIVSAIPPLTRMRTERGKSEADADSARSAAHLADMQAGGLAIAALRAQLTEAIERGDGLALRVASLQQELRALRRQHEQCEDRIERLRDEVHALTRRLNRTEGKE